MRSPRKSPKNYVKLNLNNIYLWVTKKLKLKCMSTA